MQSLARDARSELKTVKTMGEIVEGLARLFSPQL